MSITQPTPSAPRIPVKPANASSLKPPLRDEPITPPSVMLLGDTGSGKTHSIVTALRAGLEVFVLVTENTGVETLIDACEREKIPVDRLHWHRCTPTQQSWATMKAQAKLTNTNSVGELQKLEAGLERFKYPGFMNLLTCCENFICQRTKKEYGNVSDFKDDRLLVLDSQSGLNEIVGQHVTGHRITMTQPEFGVVQNHIWQLLNTFCGLSCFFLLTGHLENETDEVSGQQKFMVATVGKKLAPKLPRMFSEVVLAKQEGNNYVWSTEDKRVATKVRALPRGVIPADFKILVDLYQKRKLEAEKETITQATL